MTQQDRWDRLNAARAGRYLTQDETARLCGVRQPVIRKWIDKGLIRGVPEAGSQRTLVSIEDAERPPSARRPPVAPTARGNDADPA